jgi:hypothetical protein
MNNVRGLGRREPLVVSVSVAAGVVALSVVLGLAFGLLVGWVIFPVQWTDATPAYLREDLQIDYMRMVLDSYSVNRNADLAMDRYESLGAAAKPALDAVAANPGDVSDTAIQSFYGLIEVYETETEQPSQAAPSNIGAAAAGMLLPVCGLTLVVGLGLAGVLFWRSRTPRSRGQRPESDFEETEMEASAEADDVGELYHVAPAARSSQAALATFRTIYTLGDDLYDDSFSIESPSGDFLGECGVGIGDVIGVGDPKKVSALEVWLFDKNDIQTVTKVLLSTHAQKNDEIRTRMAAKGDPVLAESGETIVLETASLMVEARVVDLVYGESALPNESYFERMTLELRASRKGA